MRVVVTGATGNVGTSLTEALCAEPTVTSVVALARRPPEVPTDGVEWVAADVVTSDLTSIFTGADAVVHLAWVIQPSHRGDVLRATNVVGSRRVFQAAADAGVRTLVHASSVGAYSPGPKDRPVDETWPTQGIDSSFYSRHKVEVERLLDSLEAEQPQIRTVRLRPGLIFKREAASRIRALFFGPLVPTRLLRPAWIPAVPRTENLVFQAVHTTDVADAYRRVVCGDARGAFNLAADPVLDGEELGQLLRARPLPIPPPALRALADITWRLHLQPTPPGWLDMALNVPVLDSGRARRELNWSPRFTSGEALVDLLEGLAAAADGPTPALARRTLLRHSGTRDYEKQETAALHRETA